MSRSSSEVNRSMQSRASVANAQNTVDQIAAAPLVASAIPSIASANSQIKRSSRVASIRQTQEMQQNQIDALAQVESNEMHASKPRALGFLSSLRRIDYLVIVVVFTIILAAAAVLIVGAIFRGNNNGSWWNWFGFGNSNTATNTVSGTNTLTVNVTAPTNFQLGAISASTCHLAWTPAAGANVTGGTVAVVYEIDILNSTVNNGGYSVVTSTLPQNFGAYLLTNLTPGTSYTCRICGIDANGTKSPFSYLNFNTANIIQLTTPTNFTATPLATEVVLSWNAVSGAIYYNLQYMQNGITLNADNITSTSITVPNLEPLTQYTFLLNAINPDTTDYSNSTSPATITTTTVAPIGSPASLTATLLDATHVTLTWPAVPHATSYTIYSALESTPTQFTVAASGVVALSTSVAVAGGAQYIFSVQSVSNQGFGESTNPTVCTPIYVGQPSQVTGLAATIAGPNSIVLSWNAAANATSYSILISTDNSNYETAISNFTPIAANISQLARNTEYYFAVESYNGTVAGNPSQVLSVTLN